MSLVVAPFFNPSPLGSATPYSLHLLWRYHSMTRNWSWWIPFFTPSQLSSVLSCGEPGSHFLTRLMKELPELDQFSLGTLVFIRDANADADPEEDVDAVDLQAYALQTDQLRDHLFANILRTP
jgi:hypothetical protein